MAKNNSYIFSFKYSHATGTSSRLEVSRDKISLNGKPIPQIFIQDVKKDLIIIVKDYPEKEVNKCSLGDFKLVKNNARTEKGCISSIRFKALQKAFTRLQKYTALINPKLKDPKEK